MDRSVDCRLRAEHLGLAYRLLIAGTGPNDEVLALLEHEMSDALPDTVDEVAAMAVQTLYALAIVASNHLLDAFGKLASKSAPSDSVGLDRLRASMASTLDEAMDLFSSDPGALGD